MTMNSRYKTRAGDDTVGTGLWIQDGFLFDIPTDTTSAAMGRRNNVSHMGSQPNGQVSKPATLLGSYPSPVQRYADPVPYPCLPNQGRSLPAQQHTWQSVQQFPASPQRHRQLDRFEAPPLLDIDPRLLQLSKREEITTRTMLNTEGQQPLLELTQELYSQRTSYAEAARLPKERNMVCQSPYPTEILPADPNVVVSRPKLPPWVDAGQRPAVQLSMRGQPAIIPPRHVEQTQADVLLRGYMLPTHVNAAPYRAGQSNDVQPRIMSAAFMANVITIARYVAEASYTQRTLIAMSATHMTLHVHTSARTLVAGILRKGSSAERI
ncbi:hypothetical protein LTS10_002635 [Elasticomyces elasticus]|nr:hypothetical protein LTS10_002635 [Elasticomyces elasticus]